MIFNFKYFNNEKLDNFTHPKIKKIKRKTKKKKKVLRHQIIPNLQSNIFYIFIEK